MNETPILAQNVHGKSPKIESRPGVFPSHDSEVNKQAMKR